MNMLHQTLIMFNAFLKEATMKESTIPTHKCQVKDNAVSHLFLLSKCSVLLRHSK